MRIKLCSYAPLDLTSTFAGDSVQVNPTALFLKHYYDIHGLNPNVEWLTPDIVLTESVETKIEQLLSEEIDILGLSVYVWNESYIYYLAEVIKEKKPNTVIVVGGPQLDVHRTDHDDWDQSKFFNRHPYVDYVVYGDGEKAFQQIIDYETGFLKNKTDFVNIVEPDDSSNRQIYPLEILSDSAYLSTSPVINNKTFIINTINDIVSKGIERTQIIWALEFARGCMYSCSFCDWGQNLTKKVKRRTSPWKDDIDFFISIDIKIRETDANFGMWKEDLEIFNYCISKYDPTKNFKFIVVNTPKLKKEVTEYIFKTTLETYQEETINLKFSLQDTNEEVLSAINRPTVPWSRIEQMVHYFRSVLPEGKFQDIEVEMILGMPGQTLDHMIENYIKLYCLGITNLILYDYWYLKNSPASDLMYRKMWGIELMQRYSFYKPICNPNTFKNLDQLYYELGHTKKHSHTSKTFTTIHKTKHMNEVEQLASKLIYWHFLKFIKAQPRKNIYEVKYTESEIRKYLTLIKNKSLRDAEEQFALHRPYIEKYGYCVTGWWDEKNKTYNAF